MPAIAASAACAPTNNYGLRIVMLDDATALGELEAAALSMVKGV